MRCVALRHDASIYMHGRIVTKRSTAHEKRVRVGPLCRYTQGGPLRPFNMDKK